MSTKELIFQEIEQLPESMMADCLELVRSLKTKQNQDVRPEVWNAYLESVTEREEVYRRLADS
jgi:tRNA A-37 threonylcarbamoyl transferase component Bud32